MHIPANNPLTRRWPVALSDTQPVTAGMGNVPFARCLIVSADCRLNVQTLGGDAGAFWFFKGYNPCAITHVFATGSVPNGADVEAGY